MLLHTPEQRALSDAVSALLAEVPLTPPAFPGPGAAVTPVDDQDRWRRLAKELGLVGLLVPETHGGSGGSWPDLAVVLEALGYALDGTPYLSSAVLAAEVLLASTDDTVAAAWLPRISDGSAVGSVALRGVVTAHGEGPGLRVSGVVDSVLDGERAQLLAVPADRPEGRSIVLVDLEQPGVRTVPQRSLDVTRSFSRLDFTDAAANVVVDAARTPDVLRRLELVVGGALAAEQAGAARRCLDDAVAYAGTRYQFARPIGSFQSVKHRLAQCLVEVTSAEAAAREAAAALQVGDVNDATELIVATAVVAATETYLNAARTAMQVHGGIGFTWEATSHLHYRRARTDAGVLGGTTRWRRRIASALLEGRSGEGDRGGDGG